MRWAALLAGSMCLWGQTPDTVLQLARIKRHAIENLRRQPNYTCVETVERSRRSGGARRAQMQDTLRLEVALVDGKEMFGWPGARKFDDLNLRDLIPDGAIGNGNFAMHARAVFEGMPSFHYEGTESADGRASVQYSFRVSQFASGFKLRVQDREAVVGYHGSFSADAETLDLRRLDVIADDIPVALGLNAASDHMEYARLRIGEGDFLLPSASELILVDMANQESRNRVRFTGCRQFSGESVITFDDPPPAAEPAAPAKIDEIELPADLGVTLSLIEDVDTEAAAVGDTVRARLQNDIKHKGRVLFLKGATAVGRITRLEKMDNETLLGIEFIEMEAPGLRARLKMKLEDFAGATLLAPRPRERWLPSAAKPGEGIIPLRPGRVRLAHGILMFWRT
jgi:hypothetical protein